MNQASKEKLTAVKNYFSDWVKSQLITDPLRFILAAVLLVFYALGISLAHAYTDPAWNLSVFLLCFFVSILSVEIGIGFLVLVLPLVTGLEFQVNSLLNVSISPIAVCGLDACLGTSIAILLRERHLFKWRYLYIASPFLVYLLFSGTLAVIHNTTALNSVLGQKQFILSLFRFRELTWHQTLYGFHDSITFSIFILCMTIILEARISRSLSILKILVMPTIASGLIVTLYAILQYHVDIGYSRDAQRGVASVFPDIHTFAGFLSFSTIASLIGLEHFTQKRLKVLSAISLLLSCYSIILSGSRAQFALTFMLVLILISIQLLKIRIKIGLLKTTGLFFSFFGIAGFFFHARFDYLIRMIARQGEQTWETFNYNFSFRPEIWHFAIESISQHPLFGLGSGLFYSASSYKTYNLVSPFLLRTNGENAHNYFLQFICEYGFIGLLLIFPLFFAPIRRNKCCWLLIVSLFLSNVFAHSFLENEILLLLMLVLIFLDRQFAYRWLEGTSILKYALATLIAVLIMGLVWTKQEPKHPFNLGQRCEESNKLHDDGWIGGIYLDYEGRLNRFEEFSLHVSDALRKKSKVSYGYVEDGEPIKVNRLEVEPGSTVKITLPSRVDANKFFTTNKCFRPFDNLKTVDSRVLGINLGVKVN